MRVNYTLENTVLTVSINEPSQLEHGGKVSVVPYYGNEAGRKCKKIVHSDFEGNPYIWWNAQKVFLEEYDVPSAEEIVRRYKEKGWISMTLWQLFVEIKTWQQSAYILITAILSI